jgi:hypothetical protein
MVFVRNALASEPANIGNSTDLTSIWQEVGESREFECQTWVDGAPFLV